MAAELNAIQKTLLENIADLHEVPTGAYNIRSNGGMLGRNTTANINIVTKTITTSVLFHIFEMLSSLVLRNDV